MVFTDRKLAGIVLKKCRSKSPRGVLAACCVKIRHEIVV